MMTDWIVGGSGRNVLRENPALLNIRSNSANVYASPDGVPESIIMLKPAASGGVTRSSFGTNSIVTAAEVHIESAAFDRLITIGNSGFLRVLLRDFEHGFPIDRGDLSLRVVGCKRESEHTVAGGDVENL